MLQAIYKIWDNLPKLDTKSMLCVDHSAMLFPNEDFMNWIFRGTLFGADFGGAFDFFGRYNIDEAKSNNAPFSATKQTTESGEI